MVAKGNGYKEGCKPPPGPPPKPPVPPTPPKPPGPPPGPNPGVPPAKKVPAINVPEFGTPYFGYPGYFAPGYLNDNDNENGYGVTVIGKPTSNPVSAPLPRALTESSSSMSVHMNGTWFLPNGLGASYVLYSLDGLTPYYIGTLCGPGGDDQVCEINMLPGNYKYRVDGLFDPDAANLIWEFCKVKGGASTELSITINEDCECVVTEVFELKYKYNCEDFQHVLVAETVVTLSGTFDLGGMLKADLTQDDETAIRNAINKEISDASNNQDEGVVEVSKLSWSAAPSVDGSRRLDEQVGPVARVSFEVKLLGERFGMKKAGSDEYELLAGSMKNYLTRSMSAGVFVAKLVHAARSQNSDNLQSVNFARLINLNVVHEIKLNEELSSVASVLVCVKAR